MCVQERRNTHRLTTTMRESGPDKLNCRWSWLEHQIDTKSPRRGRVENSIANLNSYAVASFDPVGLDQGEYDQLRKFLKLEQIAGARSPTPFLRKTSNVSRRMSLIRDDESSSSSPAFRSYMASTESAKAKARSNSIPKQRTEAVDTFPYLHSPSKYRLSPFPSVNGDDTNISSKIGEAPSSQQKFPHLKDLVGPVNSQRSLKDISVEPQCSLQNWDRSYTFR